MTPQPNPPGWFPDPHGSQQMRYWDGAEWSDHLSAPVAAAPSDHANFGRRLVAFIVDALIFVVADRIVLWPLRWAFGTPLWIEVLLGLYAAALWFAYEWFSLTKWSATPGMRALGISVRFLTTDSRNAIVRRASIFAVVFGLTVAIDSLGIVGNIIGTAVVLAFIIGCLMMLGSPLGQTWHDRLSGTKVVDSRLVGSDAGTIGGARVDALPAATRNLIYGAAALGFVFYVISMVIGIVNAASRYPFPGRNPFQ